jgi:hypothetical protein
MACMWHGCGLVRQETAPPLACLGANPQDLTDFDVPAYVAGLSRFADHSIRSSEAIRLVRECPLKTALDRAIGHATGTVSPVCVLVLHKSIVENRYAQHKYHNVNRGCGVVKYR